MNAEDDETFTRLLYYGTVHLNRNEEEIWFMPLGLLLDLIECHRQHLGLARPLRMLGIDEIIPYDI